MTVPHSALWRNAGISFSCQRGPIMLGQMNTSASNAVDPRKLVLVMFPAMERRIFA